MPLSMYQASIPVFVSMLGNLAAILAKAAEWAETRKIDPAVLVNARLAPDMLPLSGQVQIASDTVKGCAARLAGIAIPSFADTETTFAELQDRIARTVTFLQSVGAAQIEGSEDRKVTIRQRDAEITLSGPDYLFLRVIPNFYFHVTTAYDILRHNGLEIGKRDFLSRV